MGFLGNLFKREATGLSCSSSSSSTTSTGGSYTTRQVYAYREETALTVSSMYRAADLRSSSLALLKLQYMRYVKRDKCLQVDNYGEGKIINFLLANKPNKRQNAYQFWREVELIRIFFGHCIILPIRSSDGMVRELVPCHADWNERDNTYNINEPNKNIVMTEVPADDVIVIRGIVTRAHPEGESILHYAARTNSLAATIQSLQLDSASKGGRVKGIMQQDTDTGLHGLGGLNEAEMERAVKNLSEKFYDQDLIYDNTGGKFIQLSMSSSDMELISALGLTTADISRFTGVPLSMLADNSGASYKTPEAASLEFLSRTLLPIVKEIEAEFNSKLLSIDDYGVREYKFDTRPLFQLDLKTKGEYDKLRLETGQVSVNELRAENNMPAIENGDDHFVSANVIPLGSPKLSGDTAPASEPVQPQRERNAKGQFVSTKKS